MLKPHKTLALVLLAASPWFANGKAVADTAKDVPYGVLWAVPKGALTASESDGLDLRDVLVDSSGNVIVVGGYCTNNTCDADGILAKISPSGSVIWKKKISNFSINSVSRDSADNYYLGGFDPGTAGNHLAEAEKYDANGNFIWHWQHDNTGGPNDLLRGIVFAGSDAYAIGTVGVSNYLTQIIGASGTQGMESAVNATAIAVDATPIIYVALSNKVDGYNPSLLLVWSRSPAYTAANSCLYGNPNRIRIAPDGTPYVFQGYGYNSGGGGCYLGYPTTASAIGLVNSSFERSEKQTAYIRDVAFLPTGQVAVTWADNAFASQGGLYGLSAASNTTESGGPFNGQPVTKADWEQTNLLGINPHAMGVGSNGYIYVIGNAAGDVPDSQSFSVVALANPASKPPTKGALEVRNNVIHVGTSVATVIANGTPGASVELEVYSMAGIALGEIEPITIGADGIGVGTLSGTVKAGNALPSGMYWIVTNGDIRARKPVLIVAPKKTQ